MPAENGPTIAERTEILERKMKIPKAVAAQLARLKGIDDLVASKELAENNLTPPEFPESGNATFLEKEAMVAYLAPWIEVDTNMSSRAYEALAIYCAKKAK